MVDLIIDSSYASLKEAIWRKKIPANIRETLRLVAVQYISFDGKLHQGQLVVHEGLADEVRHLFASLLKMRFPINSVIPVAAYDWSDDTSMEANNSSAFNIRRIPGTERYSQHSYGWALDLNPMQNPCFDYRSNTITPCGARYNVLVPGALTHESPVVLLFKSYGWVWGGDWTSLHDYMHFEKRLDGLLS